MEIADGIFKHDEINCVQPDCNPVVHANSSSKSSSSSGRGDSSSHTGEMMSISLADMRDIRFNLHQANIHSNSSIASSTGPSNKMSLSATQAVGRTILHLADMYSVATFCIYPVAQSWLTDNASTSSSSGVVDRQSATDFEVVYIKLIGRNCWFCNPTASVSNERGWKGEHRPNPAISDDSPLNIVCCLVCRWT
jgi:hypothetical protein